MNRSGERITARNGKVRHLSMKIIDQGGVAQLGERDTGSVEVMGSSPTVSSYRRVCHFPFI